MARQSISQLGVLLVAAAISACGGCAAMGWGRNPDTQPLGSLGTPDMHPFSQPFPHLQSSRGPLNLPAPERSDIALTQYTSAGEIIELPAPGEALIESSGEIPIELPGPESGEACMGGCANGMCSTEGLNIQGGPSCAPYPPDFVGPNAHAAAHAEKQQGKSRGTQFSWCHGWKKDRNPDMAFNNPRFPRELRMASHPQYVVEPPDVLYIEALTILPNRPLLGERLIRQDGTISLGYYGQVHVAGLTLLEVENKIREHLKQYVENPQVYVDVASFNSKVYYVLGQVQQQGRLPITGKETVLDAVTLAGGITNFAHIDKMHIARPNPGGGCDQVLWVDWKSLAFCGDTRTNYQIMPGDRIVVPGTAGWGANRFFDNYLTPVERLAAVGGLFRFAFRDNN